MCSSRQRTSHLHNHGHESGPSRDACQKTACSPSWVPAPRLRTHLRGGQQQEAILPSTHIWRSIDFNRLDNSSWTNESCWIWTPHVLRCAARLFRRRGPSISWRGQRTKQFGKTGRVGLSCKQRRKGRTSREVTRGQCGGWHAVGEGRDTGRASGRWD